MVEPCDICVIGAGPAGIASALELASKGLSVTLVESGTEGPDESAQQLSEAQIVNLKSHSSMQDAVCRMLGGTSSLWGGRCVPLDPIDFEHRAFVAQSGWPILPEDLEPFYKPAARYLGVGPPNFTLSNCQDLKTKHLPLSQRFIESGGIHATQLERWSQTPNTWRAHRSAVHGHPAISVLEETTCVGFCQEGNQGLVRAAILRRTADPHAAPSHARARAFVVACGGVESTRLILNSMDGPAGLKVAAPDLVGRYYMGHPSGSIADVQLFGEPSATLYGFERDGSVYVRRRITMDTDVLRNHKLLNIAFWLDNAPLADWRHRSGVLSAAYLALTTPFLSRLLAPEAVRKRAAGKHGHARWRHVVNCLRSPISTGVFATEFIYQRFVASPRLPGFFTYSNANRYALHYHAEQAPNDQSLITLSNQVDALGMRRAQIDLEWSKQDIDSIVRAHSLLDEKLQRNGVGRLVFRFDPSELENEILEQAVDGFHQLGTLRMSDDHTRGVTDPFGRLFGTSNLYIASGAIFPTSGQANPTLAIVALAVRQAHHIAGALASPTCVRHA